MIEVDNILDIKNYIKDVEVVIFDLDDTLYNEVDYVKSGYKKISDLFPSIKNMYEQLWNVFLNGGKAIDVVLNDNNLIKYKDKCIDIYRNQIPNIKIDKKVLNLLNEIKPKKLGMITDGRPEGQKAKIKALNIEELFDYIIITDELGGIEYRKPNEKAFVLMKEFFNCDYNKMVYIGDNIKKDFIAPNKLGMKSIHFKNVNGLYYNK